ncbi:MAG: nitrogen fixation protein NifX [Epsilonproteobacteria bacterium]|nr:nitrogen fixation protein NifX [Campylobacterota bacterium]
MKIAFASTDKVHIDQHFGWSKTFQLFEVDKESASFIKEIDSSIEYEDEMQKLTYKINTIQEADMLYCTQIGPSASKMVQAAKIHPIRSSESESIAEAITKLQAMLHENPPPWLLRIYYKSQQKKEEG